MSANALPIPSQPPATYAKTSAKIWVTFAIPGVHCYPLAPDDVAYLRSPHRHLFKFKVEVSVFHHDREIEFHQLLNWCRSLYQGDLSVDYKSCEMLAQELVTQLAAKYSARPRTFTVEVSEDGECGAVVTLNNVPSSTLG